MAPTDNNAPPKARGIGHDVKRQSSKTALENHRHEFEPLKRRLHAECARARKTSVRIMLLDLRVTRSRRANHTSWIQHASFTGRTRTSRNHSDGGAKREAPEDLKNQDGDTQVEGHRRSKRQYALSPNFPTTFHPKRSSYCTGGRACCTSQESSSV